MPKPKASTITRHIEEYDSDDGKWWRVFGILHAAVTRAVREPVYDEFMADAIGFLNHERARLQDHVVALKNEAPDQQTGEQYQLEPSGKYERTYNVQGIVVSALNTGNFTDTGEVLRAMWESGVFGNPKWTPLQKFCDRYGIQLNITRREITEGEADDDGSPIHVGQWWKKGAPSVTAAPERKEPVVG